MARTQETLRTMSWEELKEEMVGMQVELDWKTRQLEEVQERKFRTYISLVAWKVVALVSLILLGETIVFAMMGQ